MISGTEATINCGTINCGPHPAAPPPPVALPALVVSLALLASPATAAAKPPANPAPPPRAATPGAVARPAAPAPNPTPPETLALDLRTAILMALQRNRDLQVEACEPPRRRYLQLEAAGAFDPGWFASYRRAEDTDRRVPLGAVGGPGTPELFGARIDQRDEAATGIEGLLPPGTRYRMSLETVARRSSIDEFTNTFASGFRFSLIQPLLRDFGTDANLARLRLARRDVAIAEWALRGRVIDTVTEVVYIYHDLHFAIGDLAVARRSQALAEQLLADNRRRMEIGVMSPLDVTQAKAEAAQRREAVILAGRAVRDNQNFLKRLATDEIADFLAIPVTIKPPPDPAPFPLVVADGLRDAFSWRPDYRQALVDLERRRITLVFERNQARPRLDLEASLELLGLDADVAQSFGRSLDDERTGWVAGATFRVPIPNREGAGRVGAARLEQIRALLDLKRLEQDIIVRVDNAAGQATTSRERVAATREARVLAQETLAAGEERLKVGATTTFEVLELQRKLAEAEVAELRARVDLNKAIAEFDRQTGMTLHRHGILFEP